MQEQTRRLVEGESHGHKNWATWNLLLWLNNDEGIYRQAQAAADHSATALSNFCHEIVYELPDWKGLDHATLLQHVDWDSVAEDFGA